MEYTIKILKERLTFLSDSASKMAETFKKQGVTDLGAIKKVNEKFTEVQNAIKILEHSANTEYRQFTIPFVINCKATTHELKTWIPYYKAVVGGVKQFEVRKDDRNFKEGDILHLREWDNTLKEYTGRDTKMGIRYILKGGAFGVQKGYVIMGLCCL